MCQVIGDTVRWSRGSGMSKVRLVITALFVEGQSPVEVAARYRVHRAWVYKLKGPLRDRGRGRAGAAVSATEDLTHGAVRADRRADRAAA
jgi:hypothetical protein